MLLVSKRWQWTNKRESAVTKIKLPAKISNTDKLARKEADKARSLARKGMRVAKYALATIATDAKREMV